MRIDRLKELRDRLKDGSIPSQRFEMNTWLELTEDKDECSVAEAHKCGTAGCLAGWTVLLFADPATEIDENSVAQVAFELLGAEYGDFDDETTDKNLTALFLGYSTYWRENPFKAPRAQQVPLAIEAIDALIADYEPEEKEALEK